MSTEVLKAPEGWVKIIKDFFNCQTAELKALTPQDRVDLVTGIQNGTFTY